MNKKLEKIINKQKVSNSLEHAVGVMICDQESMMPLGGADARARAYGDITALEKRIALGYRKDLKNVRVKNALEEGIFNELKHQANYYSLVPEKLLREIESYKVRANLAWKEARKKSDFSIFKPYLQRTVELQRELAEKLDYKSHPYNALLYQFEEEMTVREMDAIFAKIIPKIDRIAEKTKMRWDPSVEIVECSKASMHKISKELLGMLNIPKESFVKGVSAHPFMVSLDTNDVRITTGRGKQKFRDRFFDQMHELGHAIYAFGIDPQLRDTPVYTAASFSIDESQSRFWEMMMGHSMSFTRAIYPVIKKYAKINGSENDLYRYFNAADKNATRIDSGELAYDKHIKMRYDMEKGLISGKISVSDLQSVWVDLSLEYFGNKPKNDRDGVLQDIHWADGSFGYFPTYTLGNIISAAIREEMGNVDQLIEEGKFVEIKEWLRDKIQKYGAIYAPRDLLKHAIRQTYNPDKYLKYLQEKYLEHMD